MNSIQIIKPAFTLLLALSVNRTEAQFVPSKWEVGINFGTLIYQGDLSADLLGYTASLKPSVGLWVSRSIDDYFSVRANLLRGGLAADEGTYKTPEWRSHRALSFSTSVTEISAQLVWDLAGKTYREGMHRFSPYFFAGVGLTILNVKRDWSRFDSSYFDPKSAARLGLGVDTLHSVPSVIPVIPMGVGLRYMVSNHVFVNVEGTYRFTASDYVDGFRYSGNPNKNDRYYGLTVGVSYRFGRSTADCPKSPL